MNIKNEVILLSIFFGLTLILPCDSVIDNQFGKIAINYVNLIGNAIAGSGGQRAPEEQPNEMVLPQRSLEKFIELNGQIPENKPETKIDGKRKKESPPEAQPRVNPPKIPICKDNEILIDGRCKKIE